MFRSIRSWLIIGFLIALIGSPAQAGLTLSGAVVQGVDTLGNYVGSYDWHTNQNLPSAAYSLFLIRGSDANGPIINGPSTNYADINLSLVNGDNTFTFLTQPNLQDTSYYGIALAFNGLNMPVIAGYDATVTSASSILPNVVVDPSTSQIRWDDSYLNSPGSLSYQIGSATVTLTSFDYEIPTVYNEDRVSAHLVGSNGSLDDVGHFTLHVTGLASTVPGPPSIVMTGFSFIMTGFYFLRRGQKNGVKNWLYDDHS